jgi:hypothetical protein
LDLIATRSGLASKHSVGGLSGAATLALAAALVLEEGEVAALC